FFFQAEDGIRDDLVTEFRRVLFRSVTVIGESGSLRHSVNIPVTVIAPHLYPSFHLSIDSTEAILDPGSSTTFTLTVTSLNGYSRSEERRVGKECRYCGESYHERNNH